MTREERKDRRHQNRELREERRRLRRQTFKTFMDRVIEAPELSPETLSYKNDFNTYWPAIKAALEYVEASRVSGRKLDKKINSIIDLGDDISNGSDTDTEFRDKLLEIWRVVRVILIAVVVFSNDNKADDAIDKAVEIGDWLSGFDESE